MLAIKALCFLNGQDNTLQCFPAVFLYTIDPQQHCIHDRKLHTDSLRPFLLTDDLKKIFFKDDSLNIALFVFKTLINRKFGSLTRISN